MECGGKKRGFSLIEMVLVIGLSGAILVAATALMLSFANIYLSSPSIEAEIERNIFAKKLIKMLLIQCKSSEACGDAGEELFRAGIFWKTDNVPIFVGENRETSFTVGLVWQAGSLKFAWKSEEETEFEYLVLLDGIAEICIASYDGETDSWSEHEFSEKSVHGALSADKICCLRIVHGGGEDTIPLFENPLTFILATSVKGVLSSDHVRGFAEKNWFPHTAGSHLDRRGGAIRFCYRWR